MAQELRKRGFPGRIVGVTGFELASDIEHFLQSGADRVLVKPVDKHRLNQTFKGEYYHFVIAIAYLSSLTFILDVFVQICA